MEGKKDYVEPLRRLWDGTNKATAFTQALRDHFFLAPSFEIYGGYKGLYDLGPSGCAVKNNILAVWRDHFVLSEGMYEIESCCITPDVVLRVSGHEEKFTDFMVRDVVTTECYRADHLLEDALEALIDGGDLDPQTVDEYKTIIAQVDDYDQDALGAMLKRFNVKAPETGNDITEPVYFNLMFSTSIGPTGKQPGYLRPELAQGIFVNFPKIIALNGGKVPVAGAQIGQAFRNEIAPRSGLFRVREFTLAEIEHFLDPKDKSHPRFQEVADVVVNLYSREDQLGCKKLLRLSVGEAVQAGIVDNQTLGYFVARCAQFMWSIGVQKDKLRFRQHLANEMAHYATDCWDAELLTSSGWVECVGNADRACYDLTCHSEHLNTDMTFFQEYDEPKIVECLTLTPNKGAIGKAFRGDAKILFAHLAALSETDIAALQSALSGGSTTVEVGDRSFEVTSAMVAIKNETKKVSGQHITPSVIEPSYGIGRIVAAVLEQCYDQRPEDARRGFFRFPPAIAPIKCSILPLQNDERLFPLVNVVERALRDARISSKLDGGGTTVGRRYARTDAIGIPFGVTVDYDGLEDGSNPDTVTLRERDTTEQVRVPVADLVSLLQALIQGSKTWSQAREEYPNV